MDIEDIEKLVNDEAFKAQLGNASDLAQVAALFQAQGVEVTEKQLEALLTAEEGELDEAALDDVAGGGIFKAIMVTLKVMIPIIAPVLGKKRK